MENNFQYMRIGTTMYKIVHQPNLTGGFTIRIVPWTSSAIKVDHGNDFLAQIPKFDGFCTIPSHTDFHQVVGNFYNLYQPISHVPVEGEFPNIEQLMHHIFGNQYEMGMDYLQLLYLNPVQKLPILLLVSEERETGKTTFLNFLKLIFQENATFNTNEDFRSQFNADWAGKLLIVVDEVLLSRREDSERLKNLSTAKSYKIEAKGKDRQEVQFFAKFVLCSNNEQFPVIIDTEETRYWVRKISRLEKDDREILDKIEKEIPALLFFLQHRELTTTKQSRMWFLPSAIHTEYLDKIILNNRSRTEIDMGDIILQIMEKTGVDEVCFCIDDITGLLEFIRVKAERWQVRRVFKDIWKLQPAPNALTYKTYSWDYSTGDNFLEKTKVGRFYKVTRETLCHLSP